MVAVELAGGVARNAGHGPAARPVFAVRVLPEPVAGPASLDRRRRAILGQPEPVATQERVDIGAQRVLEQRAAVDHRLAPQLGGERLAEVLQALQRHLVSGGRLEVHRDQRVLVGLGHRQEVVDLRFDRRRRSPMIGAPQQARRRGRGAPARIGVVDPRAARRRLVDHAQQPRRLGVRETDHPVVVVEIDDPRRPIERRGRRRRRDGRGGREIGSAGPDVTRRVDPQPQSIALHLLAGCHGEHGERAPRIDLADHRRAGVGRAQPDVHPDAGRHLN